MIRAYWRHSQLFPFLFIRVIRAIRGEFLVLCHLSVPSDLCGVTEVGTDSHFSTVPPLIVSYLAPELWDTVPLTLLLLIVIRLFLSSNPNGSMPHLTGSLTAAL
jgi:hypothetical protein